ncbi:MAG: C39 family peptidase [Candidatus Dormibacteraeota bacterium]|nr:C39 family peptidase [Candidatus Dormibacteraeota bacterium]
MRTAILFLLALLALVVGAITVLASPTYKITATRPTPSPLFVIGNPATPPPTPTPTPTPTATPAPTAAASASGVVTFYVPVHAQTMNLDCETAALQMGLEAIGHSYSQSALFALQPQDRRQPVMDPSNKKKVIQWGNPYTNFVGKVEGSDLGPTGYGIYYPVILSIAQSHGAPSSTGGEGVSAAQVYAALAKGHPVLVWVETGWENARAAGYTGVWTSWPDTGSKKISYSLIEHVVTLSGVSPTQVRVNDPWKSGSQYWFSKAAFEASWADFNNMAVILQ